MTGPSRRPGPAVGGVPRGHPPGLAPRGVRGVHPPGLALQGVPGGRPPGLALQGVPGGRPPGLALQGSLLDLCDEAGPGPLGSSLRRTVLGDGAWIDIRRGWMTGAGALFDRLLRCVPWRAEKRPMFDRVVDVPRLLCFYTEGQALPDPALEQAREALSDHYQAELGEAFSTAGLCLYRDGRDSVAWHGDTIGRGATSDTMVAIVSLGTPRALLRRPNGCGRALRHDLGHGD